MRVPTPRLLVAGLVAIASIGLAAPAAPGAAAVVLGRADQEQSKRGEATYLDECARCHSETLGGTEFGPALVGREFIHNWAGKTAGEMFERIRDTMPADGPGRLTAQQSVDVVAFVLHENRVEGGDQPLTADAATLKRLVINAPPAR
jgi:mono/diheme cytochrome c family protein